MRSDGTNERRLLRRRERGFAAPDWSPDGRRIAIDLNGSKIAVVNADGTRFRLIHSYSRYPRWSPNGKLIAFIGWPNGDTPPSWSCARTGAGEDDRAACGLGLQRHSGVVTGREIPPIHRGVRVRRGGGLERPRVPRCAARRFALAPNRDRGPPEVHLLGDLRDRLDAQGSLLVGGPELLEPRRPVGLAAREVRFERVEMGVPPRAVARDRAGRKPAMIEDEDRPVAVGPQLESSALSGSPGYVQSSSSTRPGSSARTRPSVRWSPSSSFQTSRKRPPTRSSSSTTFASHRPSRSGSVSADQTSSGAASYRRSNRTPARSPSALSFPSTTLPLLSSVSRASRRFVQNRWIQSSSSARPAPSSE